MRSNGPSLHQAAELERLSTTICQILTIFDSSTLSHTERYTREDYRDKLLSKETYCRNDPYRGHAHMRNIEQDIAKFKNKEYTHRLTPFQATQHFKQQRATIDEVNAQELIALACSSLDSEVERVQSLTFPSHFEPQKKRFSLHNLADMNNAYRDCKMSLIKLRISLEQANATTSTAALIAREHAQRTAANSSGSTDAEQAQLTDLQQQIQDLETLLVAARNVNQECNEANSATITDLTMRLSNAEQSLADLTTDSQDWRRFRQETRGLIADLTRRINQQSEQIRTMQHQIDHPQCCTIS